MHAYKELTTELSRSQVIPHNTNNNNINTMMQSSQNNMSMSQTQAVTTTTTMPIYNTQSMESQLYDDTINDPTMQQQQLQSPQQTINNNENNNKLWQCMIDSVEIFADIKPSRILIDCGNETYVILPRLKQQTNILMKAMTSAWCLQTQTHGLLTNNNNKHNNKSPENWKTIACLTVHANELCGKSRYFDFFF